MRTALLLSLLLVPLSAAADPTACPPGFTLVPVSQNDGSARHVCAFVIHGELQRPYPFTVTARGPLGWSPAEATRSFVPEVMSPTRRTPF